MRVSWHIYAALAGGGQRALLSATKVGKVFCGLLAILAFCVSCSMPPFIPAAGAPTRTPRTLLMGRETVPDDTSQAAGATPSATVESPTIAPTSTVMPSPTSSPSPTSTPVPTATTAPTPTLLALAPVAVIGQDAALGDVVYRVQQVTDLGNVLQSDNRFDPPIRTDGKFLRVTMRVSNASGAQVYLSDRDISLVDGAGQTYKPAGERKFRLHIPRGEDWCVIAVPPGTPKRCHVIFEVPTDAQALKLKVPNLQGPGGNQEAVIDLGAEVAQPPEDSPTSLASAATSPQTAPAAGARPTLRRGASGPDVEELQARLNVWLATTQSAGLPALVVDGVFGPRTEAAVRAFQSATGLSPDGIAGTEVWDRLPRQ